MTVAWLTVAWFETCFRTSLWPANINSINWHLKWNDGIGFCKRGRGKSEEERERGRESRGREGEKAEGKRVQSLCLSLASAHWHGSSCVWDLCSAVLGLNGSNLTLKEQGWGRQTNTLCCVCYSVCAVCVCAIVCVCYSVCAVLCMCCKVCGVLCCVYYSVCVLCVCITVCVWCVYVL